MKHVELCDTARRTFRVWCTIKHEYVLDGVDEDAVREYFVNISVRRANEAADCLMYDAVEAGPLPRRVAERQAVH